MLGARIEYIVGAVHRVDGTVTVSVTDDGVVELSEVAGETTFEAIYIRIDIAFSTYRAGYSGIVEKPTVTDSRVGCASIGRRRSGTPRRSPPTATHRYRRPDERL